MGCMQTQQETENNMEEAYERYELHPTDEHINGLREPSGDSMDTTKRTKTQKETEDGCDHASDEDAEIRKFSDIEDDDEPSDNMEYMPIQHEAEYEPNHVSIMVLGAEQSGKTALVKRFVDSTSEKKTYYDPEENQFECDLQTEDTNIKLSITDFSRNAQVNQSQYDCYLRSEEHQVYIICFVMGCSEDSFVDALADFERIRRSKEDVESKWTVMFAATCCDKTDNWTCVNKANEMGIPCIATSAETNKNVNLLFETAAKTYLQQDEDDDVLKGEWGGPILIRMDSDNDNHSEEEKCELFPKDGVTPGADTKDNAQPIPSNPPASRKTKTTKNIGRKIERDVDDADELF